MLKYKFEIGDIFAVLTILSVTFIIMGYWWAPLLSLINCIGNLIYGYKNKLHINFFCIQLALIVLNTYFLK